MAQLDNVISLMERMDANDKKAQDDRAKRLLDYRNNKQSKDAIKSRAIEDLYKYIRQCGCTYEKFKSLMGENPKSYFTTEKWQEIQKTITNILSDNVRFNKYCTDHGLAVASK